VSAPADRDVTERGGTDRAAAAVRHHYDVGNDFYGLWLDGSRTYSCAMPDGDDDILDAAQERKLRFHLDAIGADRARSVLDVGCGWGSVLERLAAAGVPWAVGLTLSEEQAAHVRSRDLPGVEVRLEDWRHHEPEVPVDGIVSIGAFEHFARPEDTTGEKVRLYREFFTRCRDWSTNDATLSLQTIAYGDMSRTDASAFMQQEIFPHADLPTLAEITAAAEGVYEIRSLRNDRLHYAWTCEQWVRRLRARRDEAVELVGADVVARYERYLRLSALGFRMGKLGLLRIVAQPLTGRHFARGRDR